MPDMPAFGLKHNLTAGAVRSDIFGSECLRLLEPAQSGLSIKTQCANRVAAWILAVKTPARLIRIDIFVTDLTL
jgi:hypothetical protein